MGLAWSSAPPEEAEIATSETTSSSLDAEAKEPIESTSEPEIAEENEEERWKRREEELTKFKEDLAAKREFRKKKLGEVSDELQSLKDLLKQEMEKRQRLEEQLNKYKHGTSEESNNEDRKDKASGARISAEVEAMRISNYEDEEDEIDIIEEDGELKMARDSSEEASKSKRKGTKKRVSFSLELVKEEEFDPNEPHLETSVKLAQEEEKNNEGNTEKEAVKEEAQMEEVDEIKDLIGKNKKLENQVKALKDVTNLSKQLLNLRETQVEELNNKLAQVEEKEKDYERKMTAMKELRRLYDERGRALLVEHKNQLEMERTKVTIIESKLRLAEDLNEDLHEKNTHLVEKVKNLDNQLDAARAQLSETKIKLATEKESLYHASSQIALINNLVSQVISGPELDLDHLARFLEENHALINELTAKGDIDYVASALVGVAGGIVELPKNQEEKSDIAENLGKVWRVLIELLSHHKKADSNNGQEWESCYKSVDTPKGPKLVISVSQTFIKLKDLILEKNSLVKEVGRLKKLNDHLENRMDEQGSRLTLVTEELHNTWDVVNKLKTQHDNLHTHERILKHELQHKRSMLNGLKKQLELCREQWALAREKNSKTENDWMLLRAEFAMRKQKKKFFNSAESGYEDEEIQSPEYDTDDDKSLEIEEESPENSVGENLNQPGSVSPSDISTSESNSVVDECNGPISEILDGIFEEAIKIAKTTNQSQQSSDENIKIEAPLAIITEPDLPFIDNFSIDPNERISYSTICDVSIKRLEQIPEVEEDLSNDNSLKESDDPDDKLQVSSVTDLKMNATGSDSSFPLVNENSDNKLNDDRKNILGEDKFYDKLEEDLNKTDYDKDLSENDQSETAAKENQKSETGSLTTDEILKRRDERLKRMEESCKSLFVKMGQTSNRGNEISNKLDQIHAVYGPQATSANPATNETSTTSLEQQHQSGNSEQASSN